VRVLSIERVSSSSSPAQLGLHMHVASGYYVRSLARDLAAELGTRGHLAALRRTQVGSFQIADAKPPIEITSCALSLEDAARACLPTLELTPQGADRARVGKLVEPSDIVGGCLPVSDAVHAWFCGGELIALGAKTEAQILKVSRGFKSAQRIQDS
jgi:tRNA pseudouridine55 synthase